MQAIFLLGSERSGSNLLRTLLGNHSQISAPIAPHLCDVFFKQFKNYLPLVDKNRIMLINDINAYVNHEFNEWNVNFTIDENKLNKMKSFIDFMHFAFSEKAKAEKKIAYFSKDNHNHQYMLGLLKDIPNAKFIYLYRDPRDQVASWMRTPLYIHTPYAAINKWIKEQEVILTLRDFYQIEICPLKYEDLIADVEGQMSSLLTTLGFQIEEACFYTKKENTEASKHPLWKNINKPIKKDNYKKYKDILSYNDLNLIETLSANLLKQLSYEPETEQNWRKGNSFSFFIKEKFKTKKSMKNNQEFMRKEMGILLNKHSFVRALFSKFD